MGAVDKFPSVEAAMAASHKLQTVIELRAATGLAEQEVRDQIKTLARHGQIEHIPGRGRYDGRYGLLRPIEVAEPRVASAAVSPADEARTDADSEGGEADVRSQPRIPTDTEMSLLNVIADIRAAVGDPTGKVMLGDLAKHIRTHVDLGEAHKWACMQWERSMMDAVGEDGVGSAVEAIENLKAERDAARRINAEMRGQLDALDPKDGEIADLQHKVSMLEAEEFKLRAQLDAIAAALPGARYMDPPDGGSVTLAEQVARMRADLANATALNTKLEHLLGVERTANAALREQIDHITHGGEPEIDGALIDSYAVVVPKRPMRRFTVHDSAVAAAMAAARNGSRRGDVFALVPIGRAVRGAEWKGAGR